MTHAGQLIDDVGLFGSLLDALDFYLIHDDLLISLELLDRLIIGFDVLQAVLEPPQPPIHCLAEITGKH